MAISQLFLFILILPIILATAVYGASPEICRIQGGNTKAIWGAGFEQEQTEVFVWDPIFEQEEAIAALKDAEYNGQDLLPMTPPDKSKKLNILSIEPRGLVMAVEFYSHYGGNGFYDARAGGQVCWVKNSYGFSKPWLVRSAQPWWVYPENAHPGDRIRIFGRNIDAKLIALKAQADGQIIVLSDIVSGRHPLYECQATIPADLPSGDYDIYVHNGAGGKAGWGRPVRLSVETAPETSANVFNVRDFGAQANGIDDDTSAIRKALVKAGDEGGGIVYLPPGRYAISATLWIPPNVILQGVGSANTVLTAILPNPMHYDVPQEIASMMPGHFRSRMEQGNLGAMIWMQDNSQVADIGLVDGPGVLQAIFGSHTNCRIERCFIRTTYSTQPAVMVEWRSYGFVLRDCEIEAANGGVFMVHGPHTQAYIGGNRIRCLVPGTANNLFVRSFDRSVIENNEVRDGDRNWVSQLSYASSYHSILQGNIFTNNIPRRHNAGENMYEAGGAVWYGKVLKAGRNSVTVEGTPFTKEAIKKRHVQLSDLRQTVALVIDGRGLGQYRRVVENTDNSFVVEPKWDVAPDESTWIMVGMAYVEHLWIDNTEEHTANWTGFWGHNLGHVVDGHILRDGSGFYLWAWKRDSPSPIAYCDIIGSRIIGRGNISMIGPFVFGNTIRFSEVVDFRYRPSFHIQPTWVQGVDPSQRAGINLVPSTHKMDDLPVTAPLKDWNIIEATHIYDGPQGIAIPAEANYTILKKNAITVDDKTVIDDSQKTVIKQ